jgi:DNA-binding Lrp family transcriptional regulator
MNRKYGGFARGVGLMKQEEKEIITHLRKGKKVNISEIARELHLPISTVRDRISRVENQYVIKRSSLLDYQRMGYFANAMLAIKIDLRQKNIFFNFLKTQTCINSIYHINSGFSFLVEIVCKDSLELINWIEDIKSKFNAEVVHYQILKVEKKEAFVPN